MHRGSILSLCDWLPTDFSAVGEYVRLVALKEGETGREVKLIGLPAGGESTREEACGSETLRVLCVKAAADDGSDLRCRPLWKLSTNLRLLLRSWRYARVADEILFTGSPPSSSK